ncbi:YifB family Mg chelatase-like AAA ATPase [Catenulispora yoronensis]|uniref:YifB family Mg chelatase-like AAA ATPase n=1 Tax=Catenulispora yoronensis TaxID=450799 RepID=A0ABN2UQX0_9ACTN
MSVARTHSVALNGTQGVVVEVEVNVTRGASRTQILGLRDTVLSECRDRARAATHNSQYRWPDGNVIVGMSPAWVRKEGSAFDLAVATAALAAEGTISPLALHDTFFFAELCLDGRLRPVRGVLPAALAASRLGLARAVVAEPNALEAAQISGLEVHGMRSLSQVVALLQGTEIPDAEPLPQDTGPRTGPTRRPGPLPDLADVIGQYEARQALEVSAAGGHHLLLAGAPGAGKTLLAERLPSILPPLDQQAALEVSALHSIAGTLPRDRPLITDPPYQSVHHTCTVAGMVGGGSTRILPGAISRAHRGVLFADEIAEMQRTVLEALREPLEAGEIVIARASGTVVFPARFLLVAAMNPCPCGRAGTAGGNCTCSPETRRRYTQKLSGPFLDRMDLRLAIHPVGRAEMFTATAGEPSTSVRDRVLEARARATHRFADHPWSTNAQIPGNALRSDFAPAPDSLTDLESRYQSGTLTARGYDRLLRVAWTLADLTARPRPGPEEVGIALAFRQGLPGQLAT